MTPDQLLYVGLVLWLAACLSVPLVNRFLVVMLG